MTKKISGPFSIDHRSALALVANGQLKIDNGVLVYRDLDQDFSLDPLSIQNQLADALAQINTTTDVVEFTYQGNQTGNITAFHDLGKTPTFIEAKMVQVQLNGEAGGNWSSGQWQSNLAGTFQKTQTHHGSANITYSGALLHVANNPSVNFGVNHYARLTLTSIDEISISLNRTRNGTEMDDKLHRVFLRVR